MVLEPSGLHVERWRQIQDVRIFGQLQVRNAHFGDEERAARIDLVHQIIALHVGLQRAGELDGAGIVDADVDAAEPFHGLRHRIGDLSFVADVAKHR